MLKDLDDLKRYFHSSLSTLIEPYENKRQEAQFILWIVVALVFSITLMSCFFLGWKYLVPLIVVNIIIDIATAWIVLRGVVGNYKKEIISSIIRYINSDFKYEPTGFVPLDQFMSSGLFHRTPNVYRGEDLVSGFSDGYSFIASEVEASHVSRQKTKGRKVRRIFNGLFIEVTFQQPLAGRIFISPDTTQQLGELGDWLQSINLSQGQLVKCDHSDFEKLFIVYANEASYAQQVLSQPFLDRLVEFRNTVKAPVRVSINQGKLYIAIYYYRNLFELSLFKSAKSFESIERYYQDLKLLMTMADMLNKKA